MLFITKEFGTGNWSTVCFSLLHSSCLCLYTLRVHTYFMLPLFATNRLMDGMKTLKGDWWFTHFSIMSSCLWPCILSLSNYLGSINMALCVPCLCSDKSRELIICGSSFSNATFILHSKHRCTAVFPCGVENTRVFSLSFCRFTQIFITIPPPPSLLMDILCVVSIY